MYLPIYLSNSMSMSFKAKLTNEKSVSTLVITIALFASAN